MSGYEADVLAWSEHQAGLLRSRAAGELVNDAELDWPNIAEEIESVGRGERLALASHIRTVMEHLAKLQASAATEPRSGWEDTVLRARADIEALMQGSPSLRNRLDAAIETELPRALKLAAAGLRRYGETPRVPWHEIEYTRDQVLGDWLP